MKLTGTDFNDGGGSLSSGEAIAISARSGGVAPPSTAGDANPLQVIARMSRLLDQQNVDTQGRWIVLDPVFIELLKDEDSRLFNC